MLVTSFPADAFGTNCYVLAPAAGEQCLIVDPGVGVLDQLDDVIAKNRLHPAAVLLTHGHFDHIFSVAPVCGARGITAYVHPGDRQLLDDPMLGVSAELRHMLGGQLPYTVPDDVAELPDGGVITVAGLELIVAHAPGHTPGSVLFRVPGGANGHGGVRRADVHLAEGGLGAGDIEGDICLTGDVLFAGSIGRTDLPGGSLEMMLLSLRDKVLPLADDTVVLPGHGPASTIARERATNPYLRQVAASRATAPN